MRIVCLDVTLWLKENSSPDADLPCNIGGQKGEKAGTAAQSASSAGLHVSEEAKSSEASSGINTGADGGFLTNQQTAQSQQDQSLQHGNGHSSPSDIEQRPFTSRGQNQPG